MISIAACIKMALSFEEAVQQPHFEKTSFRINKKIFATLDTEKEQVVLKLSEIDQSVFCAFDPAVVYPVPGAWGQQGWTIMVLKDLRKEMLMDALTLSYVIAAPKRLSAKYL